MPMTASRLGQANGGGSTGALFLKLYAGEVLTAFNTEVVMMDKHQTRTISSGKSAQFPAIGKASASYHAVGTQLTGTAILHNERTITLDDKLVSDVFIGDVDEAMAHYEYRAEYTKQQGDALAQAFDRNVLRVTALAARASATITGLNGGTTINNANYLTDANELAEGFKQAAIQLDTKNIPSQERFGYVKPAQFYGLVEVDKLVDRDFAGKGSIADGMVDSAWGIKIVKTNNLPREDSTAAGSNAGVDPVTGIDVPTTYQIDARNTAAVIANRSAVGTLKLLDLQMEMDYLIDYQGTLSVAKFLLGHGILRPDAAVELRTANPVN